MLFHFFFFKTNDGQDTIISDRLQDTSFQYTSATPSVISGNAFTTPSKIPNSINKLNLIQSHVSKINFIYKIWSLRFYTKSKNPLTRLDVT